MSYALTGLAAMVVLACWFSYSAGFSLILEKRSIDPMNKAAGLLSRQSGEKSTGVIYSGVSNEAVRGEVFHG